MERVSRIRTYSMSEAAEILQFHPDALRYWLRVGQLAGEAQGSDEGWSIRPEALVAFLLESDEVVPAALAAGAPAMGRPRLAG